MDTQRDKFKFDTVEKVKDFLAYASEIGRGEMHMRCTSSRDVTYDRRPGL